MVALPLTASQTKLISLSEAAVDSCLGRDTIPRVVSGYHSNLDCCRCQKYPVGLCAQQVMLESVDYWLIANIIHKILGGKLKPVTVFWRDWWKVSSS